ncbi:serine hydrolase domain-containing protein [Actinomycetes bacterium KLBMP 9797]
MTTRRTMLRSGAAAAVTLAAGAATAAPAAAGPPVRGPDAAALQAALDALAAGAASGVLVEVRDPAWTWRGTSGVAELGTTRPVPPRGRFRVGSVTKSFLATVVLQLVAERRLALTDPVERWLPGVVPGGDRITLRHLLQHTSGIYNYTDRLPELYPTVPDIVDARFRSWTPQEILALIAGQPPLFAPGTSWSYSNTNYILLGLVVRRVTGRGWASEVRRRILDPLRLRDTETPGTNPYIRGPHSHGYLPLERDGGLVPVDITVFNPSIAGPAGEMLSTAADLNRFYGALNSGQLVRPGLLAQMRTSYPDANYGLGLETIALPGGVTLWGHTGGIFGYATLAMSTLDGRRQLTLSANPWGDGDGQGPLSDLLLAAFADLSPAPTSRTPARLHIPFPFPDLVR